MDLQATSPGVAFRAPMVRTNEWLFSCVRQLVGLQMALCDKLLVALRAHERSLSGVGSHMGLEISSLGELFEALFKGANQNLLFFLGALDLLD